MTSACCARSACARQPRSRLLAFGLVVRWPGALGFGLARSAPSTRFSFARGATLDRLAPGCSRSASCRGGSAFWSIGRRVPPGLSRPLSLAARAACRLRARRRGRRGARRRVSAGGVGGTGRSRPRELRGRAASRLRGDPRRAQPPLVPAVDSGLMAQVLPDERELRRVIGDGEGVPDGEVEGLDDSDLVELYRSMVLLRTYDERSVVYHRQGRIGTYAIFWNHEAMQAGSVYALEGEDWIFPSYRESAIGLLRGMPVSTVLSWWRGHPAGGGTRSTTTSPRSASRSGRTSRMRRASRGARSCAASRRSRSRTSATARPPRARSTRARTSPA